MTCNQPVDHGPHLIETLKRSRHNESAAVLYRAVTAGSQPDAPALFPLESVR
jgi:hypothetical protein